MLNIANQKHTHIPLHTHQEDPNNKEQMTNAGKDVGKLELSYCTGRNVKWHSHFRKQSGIFAKG